MSAILDKELIRKSLKDLVTEDTNFVNELIIELKDDLRNVENQLFEETISNIFNRYEQTFKSLA
ncbi:hypothetical protein GCM10011514_34550 [Emticicia aquatilis]|uniref:Uncharacterized protein n=1 Tax=Emticicia aquatilis TaxID=1537369 RepID=A0A916YYN2_9BACT|nr:hypothetical protein [Emticicia aquatilis]GGD67563.1 hypothetical protein GCM10011514_34550 [Emticicia aquatilis]